MRTQVAAILVSVALSACVTMESGRAMPAGVADSLVIGNTTEQDVRRTLGAPQSETTNANGTKVLVYLHTVSRSNGFTGSGEANTLALVFDTAGVLQRKSAQATNSRSR